MPVDPSKTGESILAMLAGHPVMVMGIISAFIVLIVSIRACMAFFMPFFMRIYIYFPLFNVNVHIIFAKKNRKHLCGIMLIFVQTFKYTCIQSVSPNMLIFA
jgi:hypothetical protein